MLLELRVDRRPHPLRIRVEAARGATFAHLREALAQYRVGKVRQHLTVIREPRLFMRHRAFQQCDGEGEHEIGDVETEHAMARLHTEDGRSHSD